MYTSTVLNSIKVLHFLLAYTSPISEGKRLTFYSITLSGSRYFLHKIKYMILYSSV